jgi:hypothetical protein
MAIARSNVSLPRRIHAVNALRLAAASEALAGFATDSSPLIRAIAEHAREDDEASEKDEEST